MIVLSIFLSISCGSMLSNFAMSIFSQSKISENEQVLYAISMKKSQNLEEIESVIPNAQSLNAAGLVFKNGEDFHLIANLYENKTDAQLVKENLFNNGFDVEILKINIPSYEYEGNFDASQKLIFSESLKANFKAFQKLYDISVGLDTGIKNQLTAKFDCNTVYSDFLTIKSNFETLFNDFEQIKKSLDTSSEYLKNLIDEKYSNSSQTFSSLIKETYCKLMLSK